MKWHVPAKTFLVGEYAALANLGAILLMTSPCFELTLTDTPGLDGIHPESPAGLWWSTYGDDHHGIHWHDPWNGCGGLGASSAQFVGVYRATEFLHSSAAPGLPPLIDAYWQCAWSGKGLRPSGYDVAAQSLLCFSEQKNAFHSTCVSIHRALQHLEAHPWPFPDLAFIIAHTNHKLATHEHLAASSLEPMGELDSLVSEAHDALLNADSQAFVNGVNRYYQTLLSMNKVCEHTQHLVNQLKDESGLLAIKGCGAMGADVLLMLTRVDDVLKIKERFHALNLTCLNP